MTFPSSVSANSSSPSVHDRRATSHRTHRPRRTTPSPVRTTHHSREDHMKRLALLVAAAASSCLWPPATAAPPQPGYPRPEYTQRGKPYPPRRNPASTYKIVTAWNSTPSLSTPRPRYLANRVSPSCPPPLDCHGMELDTLVVNATPTVGCSTTTRSKVPATPAPTRQRGKPYPRAVPGKIVVSPS